MATPTPLRQPNACVRDFARAPSWTGPPILVGVIGGSGLYKLDGIEVVATHNPITVRQQRQGGEQDVKQREARDTET